MPSRKHLKNFPRQWNDSICFETSERAKQEQTKKWNAFLSARLPQKELDPRILKIAKNREVMGDRFPYLHYGVRVPQYSLHSYVSRYDIKVPEPAPPGSSEPYSLLSARSAVAKHLKAKCGMPLEWVRPLEQGEEYYVISMDDTLYLNQRFMRRWEDKVDSAMRVLREEFDLGDQQPMWWWSTICNIGYYCPIEDYNPPQLNAEMRMRTEPFSYDSDSDSDSSESELEPGSGTETETEIDDSWCD